MTLRITVLTLFPEMFSIPTTCSLLGKAQEKGLWHSTIVDLRTFGIGPHLCVDDKPYGGGAGMVMRPDVLDRALSEAVGDKNAARFLYMSPRGRVMTQKLFQELSQEKKEIVLLCGRYEGVDQRLLEAWNFEEISLGDFVLCGGELPAMVLIEGCVRLLEGTLGKHASLIEESFSSGLLEYPQYTRPAVWQERAVPDVLLSGHHKEIAQWRQATSEAITEKNRPDLFKKYKKYVTS